MRSREIWRRSLFFSPGVLWSSVKVMEILPSLWKVCGWYVSPCPLFTLLLLICTMLHFSSTRILKMNLFSHAYSFWDIVWFYYSYNWVLALGKYSMFQNHFSTPHILRILANVTENAALPIQQSDGQIFFYNSVYACFAWCFNLYRGQESEGLWAVRLLL